MEKARIMPDLISTLPKIEAEVKKKKTSVVKLFTYNILGFICWTFSKVGKPTHS